MADEKPIFHLRDRLRATLSEFHVADPEVAVEAVCNQFTTWMRLMADGWNQESTAEGDVAGYGRAAAVLLQGLADGIEAGRPPTVTDQDSGV